MTFGAIPNLFIHSVIHWVLCNILLRICSIKNQTFIGKCFLIRVIQIAVFIKISLAHTHTARRHWFWLNEIQSLQSDSLEAMNSIDQKAINIILYEHWCENLNIGHMDFFLLFFCLVSLVYYTWIQNFHVSIFFLIPFFPIQKLRTCDSKTKITSMYICSFPCQNQDLREISEKYGELAYNILKPTEINVCVHWTLFNGQPMGHRAH